MPELTPELLVKAYANGYFPMAEPKTGEVSWYRPDPRAILPLDQFHVSRSLQKVIDRGHFRISFDKAFESTMRLCANRGGKTKDFEKQSEATWISEEFVQVYSQLANLGFAHSVEVWQDNIQVGGAYGVAIRAGFFAESMFHRESNASKVALFHLLQRLKQGGYQLFEVQFLTPHLKSLGAIEISGKDYDRMLEQALSANAFFSDG